MPVALAEWRARIGTFLRHPPIFNKQEVIKNFMKRAKEKRDKLAARSQDGETTLPPSKDDSLHDDEKEPSAAGDICQTEAKSDSVGCDVSTTNQDNPASKIAVSSSSAKSIGTSSKDDESISNPASTLSESSCDSRNNDVEDISTPQFATSPSRLPVATSHMIDGEITLNSSSTLSESECASSNNDVEDISATEFASSPQELCVAPSKAVDDETISTPPSPMSETASLSRSTDSEDISAAIFASGSPGKPVTSASRNGDASLSSLAPTRLGAACPTRSPDIEETSAPPFGTSPHGMPVSDSRSSKFPSPLKPSSHVGSHQSRVVQNYQNPKKLPTLAPQTTEILTQQRPSVLSRALHRCQAVGSGIKRGLSKLYISRIRLQRAGDIETNPGPNTSGIEELELHQLACDIDPEYYMALGLHLKFKTVELKNIKGRNQGDITQSIHDVFMKWKDKHGRTNQREVLAECLTEIGLDSLAGRILGGNTSTSAKPSSSSSSSTRPPPLSDKQVEQCKSEIMSHFRTHICQIKSNPLDPDSLVDFEEIFTNLKVLEEPKSLDSARYQNSTRAHGKWKHLTYTDLLNIRVNGEVQKRLIVQGEAGAGKTTLCAKIAWDWINGHGFEGFTMLLVIPLRDVQNVTVGEIAKAYLSDNNPVTAEKLTEYISGNQDKVFIIFDGLDEFKEDISQSHLWDIIKIFRSEQLMKCLILVTSRPWKADQVRWDKELRKIYSFIRVEGFTKTNLEAYIQKFFISNEGKANKLIQVTMENDIIAENMAPYPIYAAMLCVMWRDMEEEKLEALRKFKTFSQLFREMIFFLKYHYAQKQCQSLDDVNDYVENINEDLGTISNMAYHGLKSKQLTFTKTEFEECKKCMQTALEVGLLSQKKKIISWEKRGTNNQTHMQSTLFFPHKLFQEYMAGLHVASMYTGNRKEYENIIDYVLPRKKEFKYMLYFAVSQRKEVGGDVISKMSKLIGLTMTASDDTCRNDEWDFLADVTLECHDAEVAESVRKSTLTDMKRLEVSENESPHTIASYVFIGTAMKELVVSKECGLTLSLELAATICSSPSLEKVEIQGASLHKAFYSTLSVQAKNSKVKTLSLEDIRLTDSSSQDLATCLSNMPHLTDLILLGFKLQEALSSAMKSLASSIQVKNLSLKDIPLTDSSSQDLATCLCHMPLLTDLTLQSMNLHEPFFSTMKSLTSSVQVKNFSLVEILLTDSSSQDLATCLCNMPHLTDLTLRGWLLHKAFFSTMQYLASSIQLKRLSVVNFRLTESASQDLATCLCHMPHLTDLTLNRLKLHEAFFSTMQYLASSIQLKSLSVVNFRLTESASQDLATCLCNMPHLTDLNLNELELHEAFFSTMKTLASSIQMKSLSLYSVRLSDSSSQDLATCLCNMPHLPDLTLKRLELHEIFFSTMKSLASSIQVKNFCLVDIHLTDSSSQDLATCLCHMPYLTDLNLNELELHEAFFSTMKSLASSIQMKSLSLDYISLSDSSSQDLATCLCHMPLLTDLTLYRLELYEAFFSTMKSLASSIQVKTLSLKDINPSESTSKGLATCLGHMPHLTDLTLDKMNLHEAFCSTMKSLASSIQGVFPQVSKGNFMFNKQKYSHVDTLIQALLDYQRTNYRTLAGMLQEPLQSHALVAPAVSLYDNIQASRARSSNESCNLRGFEEHISGNISLSPHQPSARSFQGTDSAFMDHITTMNPPINVVHGSNPPTHDNWDSHNTASNMSPEMRPQSLPHQGRIVGRENHPIACDNLRLIQDQDGKRCHNSINDCVKRQRHDQNYSNMLSHPSQVLVDSRPQATQPPPRNRSQMSTTPHENLFRPSTASNTMQERSESQSHLGRTSTTPLPANHPTQSPQQVSEPWTGDDRMSSASPFPGEHSYPSQLQSLQTPLMSVSHNQSVPEESLVPMPSGALDSRLVDNQMMPSNQYQRRPTFNIPYMQSQYPTHSVNRPRIPGSHSEVFPAPGSREFLGNRPMVDRSMASRPNQEVHTSQAEGSHMPSSTPAQGRLEESQPETKDHIFQPWK